MPTPKPRAYSYGEDYDIRSISMLNHMQGGNPFYDFSECTREEVCKFLLDYPMTTNEHGQLYFSWNLAPPVDFDLNIESADSWNMFVADAANHADLLESARQSVMQPYLTGEGITSFDGNDKGMMIVSVSDDRLSLLGASYNSADAFEDHIETLDDDSLITLYRWVKTLDADCNMTREYTYEIQQLANSFDAQNYTAQVETGALREVEAHSPKFG